MGRTRLGRREVLALSAAVVGAAILALAMTIFVGSAGFGYDFAAYDSAARRLAVGEPLYLPDTPARYAAGQYEGLYLYPPPLAIALIPLTVLPPETATMVWMLLRVAMLVGACAILPVAGWIRAATFAVACISYPVLFDLNLGNISLVIVALAAVAWRWMDRPVAAFAHASLVAVRFPFGIFFVEWLVERRWRAIAWTIGAGLALIALSLPIVGIGTYLDYVTILRDLPDISTGPHNLSLKSFALAVGAPEAVAGLLNLVGYAAGLAAIVYAGLRRDRATAFVVTATTTLLVAPFIHPHYLVLLLLPAAWLTASGHPWALALPLLGWLPDAVLPLVAPATIGLLLLLARDPDTVPAAPATLDAQPVSAAT
jgi:alpha-1,2-mannosyltransferase